MKLLRAVYSVFVWVWVATWFAACVCAALVVAIVSREAALAMARLIWVKPVLWVAGARLRVESLPEMDWKKPHIFAMNHQSNLDIPAAILALPVKLRIVAKHSLRLVPFMGWYMWATGMIFVDRGNRARAMASLKLAGQRIRAGANILIFPEGTRSRDGKILPYKKGAFAMALEAGVPIVPVAIHGSGTVQPADEWTVRPGVIRVKVGQPIPTEGRSIAEREALANEVREATIRLHLEIGGQGGDAVALPPPGKSGAGKRQVA